METRANHVWVGAVTLALLAALALAIVWIAGLGKGAQKEYDIFFKQSVAGLAKGSEVSFAGVPVGQVNDIKLWEKDPEFVRVRIKVKEDVPILNGRVNMKKYRWEPDLDELLWKPRAAWDDD